MATLYPCPKCSSSDVGEMTGTDCSGDLFWAAWCNQCGFSSGSSDE